MTLKAHPKFIYLPHIAFQTPSEQKEIRKRGMQLLKKGKVSDESKELGTKFKKEIEAAFISSVSIRWINESVGHGLFAEEDLNIGNYVGEYTGIVRRNDRIWFEPLNNYCYEYPVPDELDRSYVIDATQGNLTRFINHSFSPNLKSAYAFYDGFYHLIFLAIQPIEKGMQLLYNYGKNYWYLREKPADL